MVVISKLLLQVMLQKFGMVHAGNGIVIFKGGLIIVTILQSDYLQVLMNQNGDGGEDTPILPLRTLVLTLPI